MSAAGLDGSNARTGTWSAKATLASGQSWTKLNHVGTTVATNKTYAASIWVKGTGKLRLDIVDSAWANNLASVTFTATSSWQQVSVPSFSSGSNTTVHFSLYDQVGGVAGTVYFDDAFLGLPGGSNLLSNPGFESGSSGWVPSGVFGIAQSASCTPAPSVTVCNTRAGTWSAKAALASGQSWTKLNHVTTTVAQNTTYTASIWVKGAGKLRLDIVDNAWANNLASVTINGSSAWQQVAVPDFSSGSHTKLNFSLYDHVGGVAGSVYFDDAFLGPPGGTNLLSNPGFESGASGWTASGVFSVAQRTGSDAGCTTVSSDSTCDRIDDNCDGWTDESCLPAATTCPNGTMPGRSGCTDMLDALGREVSELQRLAADPATPPASRPTGERIKAQLLATQNEVERVVDSIPSDLSLRADDDLRPYVASLGRALSAEMLATLPPLGTLPDGTRSRDRLEGTSVNPTVPLFSELISRLAYQDDGQEQTRALYRLADLQNLIHSLNRTELMQLDLGFSRAATRLVRELFLKKKTVAAIAFYDTLIPPSLLIYDAAKRRYMPRVYEVLRFNPNQLKPVVEPDGISYVPRGSGFADRPQLPVRQFTGTLVDQMYCKQAKGLFFVDKLGIFLEDRTHGGRLNRVRLGNVSACQFMQRVTDVTRLGSGDCSLLEIAYSGYQCASDRTCADTAPAQFRPGLRPGSTLSPLNQFGVSKTLAKATNCDPSQAMSDGLDGFMETRPGSECLVSVDDRIALQHPFLTCIAGAGGEPIKAIEPPPDPWNDRCSVIECEEGQECPSDPGTPDEEPVPENPYEETENCEKDDHTCKAAEKAQSSEAAITGAAETVDRNAGGGLFQPGYQEAMSQRLERPFPPVTVIRNADLGPGTTGARDQPNPPEGPITISINDQDIERAAYEQAAYESNKSVAACRADTTNCDLRAKGLIAQETATTFEHEQFHAILNVLLYQPGVLTDKGRQYLDTYDQAWENVFEGACREGNEPACSVQHGLIADIFNRLGRPGLSCAVDGACSDNCGPGNPAFEMSEACRALADRLRDEYDRRTTPRCTAPGPNEAPIAIECRFDDCVGAATPVTADACPFVLCNGNQTVSTNLACSCCAQCGPGDVPGGATGASPPCTGTATCNQCCIRCDVPGDQPCPRPPAPLALELPPAWRAVDPGPGPGPGPGPVDTDGDGRPDSNDNCPTISNATQANLDGDAQGDACDNDRDGDGRANTSDNCGSVANPTQHDLDGDGVGYACDSNDEVRGRGSLNGWPEDVKYEMDTLVNAHGSVIHVWWSARNATSVFIYARSPNSTTLDSTDGAEVAASGRTSFSQIANANAYSFSKNNVVVNVGQVAVLRNTVTGTYGAIRVGNVGLEGQRWLSNMTWVFGGHGSNLATVP